MLQPFETILKEAKSVLISGAGGGYDVLGGIPLAWVCGV
jgi:hypothetical protein